MKSVAAWTLPWLLAGALSACAQGADGPVPPAAGSSAPDFTLAQLDSVLTAGPDADAYEQVTLSAFRNKRPVVLIFASFT